MADEDEPVVQKGEFSEENAEISDDDSLESIASSFSDNDFSESSFEVHDMPTPTLNIDTGSFVGDTSTFKQGENLEESAMDAGEAPAEKVSEKREEEPERDYVNVYNAPDYEGSTSEEDFVARKEDLRKRGMTARNFEELRNTKKTVAWDEPEMVGGMRSPGNSPDEYSVIELGKREDNSGKSILEKRRDYNPKRGI